MVPLFFGIKAKYLGLTFRIFQGSCTFAETVPVGFVKIRHLPMMFWDHKRIKETFSHHSGLRYVDLKLLSIRMTELFKSVPGVC